MQIAPDLMVCLAGFGQKIPMKSIKRYFYFVYNQYLNNHLGANIKNKIICAILAKLLPQSAGYMHPYRNGDGPERDAHTRPRAVV
jgi:hypothetical protein